MVEGASGVDAGPRDDARRGQQDPVCVGQGDRRCPAAGVRQTLAEAVLFQDAGVIDPPPGQMPATVLSRQDGSLIDLLQPGVEYDVAVCAQQDGAWQRRQVRVGVAQFDFRDDERFRLFTKEWYYDKPVHSGDYDVEIRS